jgi:hypothetical protein
LSVLIPVYVGFIWAFQKDQIHISVSIFVLGFIGVSVLSSTLLTVDWNSRFLVAVLPLIFLIAAKEIGNNVLLLFQKTRV